MGKSPRMLPEGDRRGRSVRYKLAEAINWMDRPDYASTSEADASISSAPISNRDKPRPEAVV